MVSTNGTTVAVMARGADPIGPATGAATPIANDDHWPMATRSVGAGGVSPETALAGALADHFLAGRVAGRRVVVLAGPTADTALGAAARLSDWGAAVTVGLDAPTTCQSWGAASACRRLVRRGVASAKVPLPLSALIAIGDGLDLIVDALWATDLSAPLLGRTAMLTLWANEVAAPVVSIDNPTGLDPLTGDADEPCIRAAATVGLGGLQPGLLRPAARSHAGDLLILDGPALQRVTLCPSNGSTGPRR